MNYVEDDEEIVDAADVAPEAVEDVTPPRVPLKPWEHYTLADDLLREADALLAQANEYGRRLAADYKRDPIGTTSRELHVNGVGAWAASRLQRVQAIADLARAHSEQAAAGALLQQHLASRFSELWSPAAIASTSKEERDAELDAYPGTARRPAR